MPDHPARPSSPTIQPFACRLWRRYQHKERLKQQLLKAINDTEGFHII
jgi:hypothetical protein